MLEKKWDGPIPVLNVYCVIKNINVCKAKPGFGNEHMQYIYLGSFYMPFNCSSNQDQTL